MQSHYNYSFDTATNTYNFTTQNNIFYKIAFVVDETFSSVSGEIFSDVFQLVIEKITESTEPLDSKVSKTIVEIIETFFLKIENALIFICNDGDKKAARRHVVFERWYRISSYKNQLLNWTTSFNSIQLHLKYNSFILLF